MRPSDERQIAAEVLEDSSESDVVLVARSDVVVFPEIDKLVNSDTADDVVAVES